jgi:hypothetical protein
MARPANRELKVFHAEGGFRVMTRVSLMHAELCERMGAWRREYDTGTGDLLGFRVIGPEARKGDVEIRSVQTTATISKAEIEMNIGMAGRSKTYGLCEMDRLERLKAGELPEDRIERTIAKVRVWPMVGAAKGDVVRAWPR